MVTAFDSNVPTLQISNPFGGAGSSPAVVDSFTFARGLAYSIPWIRVEFHFC